MGLYGGEVPCLFGEDYYESHLATEVGIESDYGGMRNEVVNWESGGGFLTIELPRG
jgi:hypothetical protein